MKKTISLALFLGVATFFACNSQQQEQVSKHDFKTTESGLPFYFHIDEEGPQPAYGDFITVLMQYGKKDSVIFTSDRTGGTSSFQLGEPKYEGDLYEGLAMMSVGDSATFIIHADSFFKHMVRSQVPPFLASDKDLYFDIKMLDFEPLEELKAGEPEKIDDYLASIDEEVVPDDDGIYYIEFDAGDGEEIAETDLITLHYEVFLLDSTELFSTRKGGQPREVQYGSMFDTKGMNEVLEQMNVGGTAEFILPSEQAFGPEGLGSAVKPYSSLLYNVEILSKRSEEELKKEQQAEAERQREETQAENEARKRREPVLINAYIAKNNIDVEPTESGLYFISIEEGTGDLIQEGDQVEVHYLLRNINGEKIQSSRERGQPFKFTAGRGQVIKAWDEAIMKMRDGGKARIIAPSDLAYGQYGAGQDIPPYSPLIFEMEVMSVNTAE